MNHDTIYAKDELLKRLHRYCWDDKRLMPIRLFAKECDCEVLRFRRIFRYQVENCPRWLQVRASKVLSEWENGLIKVMTDGKKQWLDYREAPKARLAPVCQLIFKPDGIALKIGPINKSDYSDRPGLFHAAPRLPVSRTRPV
jgi:hypothetical protein